MLQAFGAEEGKITDVSEYQGKEEKEDGIIFFYGKDAKKD